MILVNNIIIAYYRENVFNLSWQLKKKREKFFFLTFIVMDVIVQDNFFCIHVLSVPHNPLIIFCIILDYFW